MNLGLNGFLGESFLDISKDVYFDGYRKHTANVCSIRQSQIAGKNYHPHASWDCIASDWSILIRPQRWKCLMEMDDSSSIWQITAS